MSLFALPAALVTALLCGCGLLSHEPDHHSNSQWPGENPRHLVSPPASLIAHMMRSARSGT